MYPQLGGTSQGQPQQPQYGGQPSAPQPQQYGGPGTYGQPQQTQYGGQPGAPQQPQYGGQPGAPQQQPQYGGQPGAPQQPQQPQYGGQPGAPQQYGGQPQQYGGSGGYGQPQQQQQYGYGQPQQQPQYGGPGGYGQPQNPVSSIDPETMSWFQAIDADRSGQITAAELQQALTTADWSSFSLDACKLIIKMFDRNHSGTVGIDEFQAVLNYIKQWQSAFVQFDRDRSGFIEQQELHQALGVIGYRLSPEFTSVLVSKFDSKNKARISLDSFFMICIQLQVYTQAFRVRDTQGRGQISLNYDEFMITVFQALV